MNAIRTRSTLSAALAFSLLLAGCGGGGGSTPAITVPQSGSAAAGTTPVTAGNPAPSVAAPSSNAVQIDNYGQIALQGASYVGPASFGSLGVDVFMKMRNADGLMAYAQQVSDPSSPAYRQFLTPQQIGDQYGASDADYKAAAAYFINNGISVAGWPQREMLHVLGPQPALEKAFGVKFGVFQRAGGDKFIAPTGAPRMPANLALAALGGIVALSPNHATLVLSPAPRLDNGVVNGYSPQQVAAAFDYTGAYRAGFTGKGINVGIIGTGPVNEGYASAGLGAGDTAELGKYYNTAMAPVTVRAALNSTVFPSPVPVPSGCGTNFVQSFYCNYSQGLATPPPPTPACTGSLPSCNPEDLEAQLDTESIAALAPGSNVTFYLAYNPAECFQPGLYQPGQKCIYGGTAGPQIGIALTDDEIQQAIADNSADILSYSFGFGEKDGLGYGYDATGKGWQPVEFATLAALGIASFVSSGDDGATGCRRDFGPGGPNANATCVSYPATDPNVVSVGGVSSPINSAGQITDAITAWGWQTTGGGAAGGFAGSGGGLSTYFTKPAFQTGPGIVGGTRNQPDISGIADSLTGFSVIYNSGPGLGGRGISGVGGTSLSAPAAAAMWALVLQACASSASCAKAGGSKPYRLGNPAPLFYNIYNNPNQYQTTFYDVGYGNIGAPGLPVPFPKGTPAPNINGYNAGPGYDLATGIGVPFARNLIKAVVGI